MIPGAPLSWIWQHPGDGFQEAPYGHSTNALPNYTWDAVTLQPFDRLLTGAEGDLAMGSNFIALALSRPANSNTQFYVYSRWPRRDDTNSLAFDYPAKWLRTYTGGWDNSNESRDYFQRVTEGLRSVFTNRTRPILMVPVGDVLYEVDQRMRAGQIGGYSNIVQVYSDGIHFNNEGSYIVGLTFFATLYREDPAGLPTAPYGVTNAAFAAAVQDAVWDAVNGHPYSGVNVVPEPRAAVLLALALLPLLRRLRALRPDCV